MIFNKKFFFCALINIFFLTTCLSSKEIQILKIGYIEIKDDIRYDPDVTYARIQLKPTGRPYTGAQVAIMESEKISEIIGKKIELIKIQLESTEEIYKKIDTLVNENKINFFLIDANKEFFKNIDKIKSKDIIIFNITVQDNSLREDNCNSNVFHTIASDAMLYDSISQYLVFKNWKKILILQGPLEEDANIANSFQQSSKKYGLKITDIKDFILSNDPRQRDSNNLSLLTAGKYDVIFLADSEGELGRYLPYSTKLPRPVVGTTGLTPETWHWSLERYGAPQLNSRFEKIDSSRRMSNYDWAAWAAINTIYKSAIKSDSVEYNEIYSFIKSKKFGLDGFKGLRLSFRSWNNQLRQPILLSTHNAIIQTAPIKGFLHEINNLDTLGIDKLESKCQIN
jgi:ABC transporter substrate binding protein (PQQ-dependent alcohol dehydrogenase system)